MNRLVRPIGSAALAASIMMPLTATPYEAPALLAQTAPSGQPGRAPRRPPASPASPATPAPAPPTAPPAVAPPSPDADPAPAAGPLPARTEILNFDNWVVTCNEFAERPQNRICAALLRIQQEGSNQTVFSWTIALDDNKRPVSILQTPTGVAIPPGVELHVGKAPPRTVPFASCEPGRCIATLTMDAGLLRDLAGAPAVEALIAGPRGNTVRFSIQMKGFDKAFAVLLRP